MLSNYIPKKVKNFQKMVVFSTYILRKLKKIFKMLASYNLAINKTPLGETECLSNP